MRRQPPVPASLERTLPIGPQDLVELLNARPMPPFPTLDELEAWGVPGRLIDLLRRLAAQGPSEEAAVLALLQLLSESTSGGGLGRQARRHILKAYKTVRPDDRWDVLIEELFREWNPSDCPLPSP